MGPVYYSFNNARMPKSGTGQIFIMIQMQLNQVQMRFSPRLCLRSSTGVDVTKLSVDVSEQGVSVSLMEEIVDSAGEMARDSLPGDVSRDSSDWSRDGVDWSGDDGVVWYAASGRVMLGDSALHRSSAMVELRNTI